MKITITGTPDEMNQLQMDGIDLNHFTAFKAPYESKWERPARYERGALTGMKFTAEASPETINKMLQSLKK